MNATKTQANMRDATRRAARTIHCHHAAHVPLLLSRTNAAISVRSPPPTKPRLAGVWSLSELPEAGKPPAGCGLGVVVAARGVSANFDPHPDPPPFRAGESHVDLTWMLHRQATWILKGIPESLGESNAEIQEDLPRLAGPAGAQCLSRFARHHRHRAGCNAVWGEGRHRHGAVCSLEGKAAAAIPAVGVRHPEPRHFQPGAASAGPGSLREDLSGVYGSLRQGP